jgi:hypothetical protein
VVEQDRRAAGDVPDPRDAIVACAGDALRQLVERDGLDVGAGSWLELLQRAAAEADERDASRAGSDGERRCVRAEVDARRVLAATQARDLAPQSAAGWSDRDLTVPAVVASCVLSGLKLTARTSPP